MPIRPHRVAIRLSDDEMQLCEALMLRKGIDLSGVMRQSMLEMAHCEGLTTPDQRQVWPDLESTIRGKRGKTR